MSILCLVFGVILMVYPKGVRAQVAGEFCAYAPNGAFGEYTECSSYTLPDNVPAAQCKNLPAGVKPGGTYNVCCKTAEDSCSVYNLRNPLCGSADTGIANVKCGYESWGLMCWGNNYRSGGADCNTHADFPAPNEFGGKYTGFLNGGGQLTQDYASANLYSEADYNGTTYAGIGNQPICVCSDAVPGGCQCPGVEASSGGESRLWFPHVRLISALSTIAQSLFSPHSGTLENNTSQTNRSPTLRNETVLTTKIEEHQGDKGEVEVVNLDDNNSSVIVGQVAPGPLYEFGGGDVYSQDAACVIPKTFNNPGDDLIGPEITGRLLFTQKYNYEACPKSPNCVGDGQSAAVPGDCCSYNPGGRAECHSGASLKEDGSYKCGLLGSRIFNTEGQVSVFVKNPLLEYVYKTLITGKNSLFARFMPEKYAGQDFEEIPSSSTYSASAISNNMEGQSVKVEAGEGKASSPTIYFPHVGSVANYWLDDFQNSLRPKALGMNLVGSSAGTGGVGSSGAECTIDGSGFASEFIQNEIAQAAKWAKIPVGMLISLVKNEAGCGRDENRICNLTDDEVLAGGYLNEGVEFRTNCPLSLDKNGDGKAGGKEDMETGGGRGRKGPVQFYHDELDWAVWQNAVNLATGSTRDTNVCNIRDSIYAGAFTLSAGYSSCPQAGYDVNDTDPNGWDLERMKQSLSYWADGCVNACVEGASIFYCNNIPGYANLTARCK